MALACQAAENHWLGVNCGIMDQMISAAGVPDRALLIDCRSLECATAPLPAGTAVVILDTGTRRGLVDSEYNQRRAQCGRGALLRRACPARYRPGYISGAGARAGPGHPQARQHVISENARTLSARDAMERGDADFLGQLMIASPSACAMILKYRARRWTPSSIAPTPRMPVTARA